MSLYDKSMDCLIALIVLSLWAWAIVGTYQNEQDERAKCKELGLNYYKAHKSPAICVKGVVL